ncbi:MAG: FtsX-like permease family protein [Marinibacterium sp.]|nr:FtsX-like permease family protein [Marinibacterium sp.]
MIRAVAQALLSHWRRHPGQFATLVLGLALATALWSAVQAINAEARASYAQAAALLTPQDQPVLVPRQGDVVARGSYLALRRDGWPVSAVLDGDTRFGGVSVTVMGVDMLSSPVMPDDLGDSAPDLGPVDLLTAPGIAIVSPDTAARMQSDPDGPRLILSEQVPPGIVLTDIAVAEALLDRRGEISRLFLLPDRQGRRDWAQVAPDLQLAPSRAVSDTDTARLTDSFHLNLTAFGLLSFAVGLFIVQGTVGLAQEQRRPMLRTLRALGVPLRLLMLCLVVELAALALLAGVLGLGLGYGIAAALLPDVAATLRGLYGADAPGSLTLRAPWVLAGLGMTLAGTALASLQSLWRLAQLPLLASASPQGWARAAARSARWQALGGLALVLAGMLGTVLFDGLLAGFALLAGLLMGAALILPPVLGQVLRIGARRARTPLAQWVWADLRAQLPGLSLALMALLLALAANIGVGTMVSSFRLTFTGWLDQRLASDLYITTDSDAQTQALRDWLTPRVDGMVPIRRVETRLDGAPGRIYGVIDDPIYREHWPLLAAAPMGWDQIFDQRGVLVNEQLARRAGLGLGDPVELGAGWSLPVVGIYSDYGNPEGQAIVALDALLARHPDLPDRQLGVRVPDGTLPALMDDLRDDFGLERDAMVDQATLKAVSLRVFEKTFVVTGALNVLTLGVAGFALLTAFLTLWTMRLPQLAPVWAMGLTRAHLARLELLRSVALAALAFVLALPLGLGLAWVLLTVINVQAFGWRLPMYLFPLDWLRLGGLALLAAALAAVIPARRLSRLPPAHLLRIFADDR